MYPKNFGKHLNKSQKHQYGLDYLLNEHNEEHINAFKKAREILNERRSIFHLKKQMKLEKNFTKKKLFITV